jgi:prepilin-type N-terminal cleavage/methylation domain-containing protein
MRASSRGFSRWQRRRCGQAGFTLLELGLVLLIIGVMLAIVVPRFGDRGHAELLSTARQLASAFRYLRQESIFNGRPYRLMFDMENQLVFVAVGDVDGGEENFAPDRDNAVGKIRLREPVVITDVNLPFVAGKVAEGTVWTTFYPDGFVDVTVVHIDNGQDVYTLFVSNPLTGQVNLLPNYLEY